MNKVIIKTKAPSKVILKDGKITPPSVFHPTDTNEKSETPERPKKVK